MNIDLRLGDCLEILPTLPDNSVDAVITDPPYNIGKDYGEYKDNRTPTAYKKWMRRVINECLRVSKNGVAFYVGGKLTSLFFELLPSAHLVIVHKRAAGVFGGNYMLQYHSLFSTIKPVVKTKDLWDDVRLPGEGYFFREQRYDTPGLTGLELTKKVVYAFTNAGDTVLDPFNGTGTTGVACVQTGRNVIGIEIEPKYFEIAEKRIAEAQLQMRMEI